MNRLENNLLLPVQDLINKRDQVQEKSNTSRKIVITLLGGVVLSCAALGISEIVKNHASELSLASRVANKMIGTFMDVILGMSFAVGAIVLLKILPANQEIQRLEKEITENRIAEKKIEESKNTVLKKQAAEENSKAM